MNREDGFGNFLARLNWLQAGPCPLLAASRSGAGQP